ncbi:MAG TPA: hypothetical protein VFG68_12970 [Fimbriiglobus sp.]|nr:hypothetical protein [Fimbriiglobus sp.]
MRTVVRAGWVLAVGFTGCYAVPPVENPVLVAPAAGDVENPIVVAPGVPTPASYAVVYDRVLDALDDYFDVIPGSRYSGEVRTLQRIAAGYEQPWKPGTPDPRERLLATFQTIRHYAVARITAGERGGYRVYVEVHKELEDLAQPTAATGGGASFREMPTVDRQVELAAPIAPADRTWIPAGRDFAFEQVILRKIQQGMCR